MIDTFKRKVAGGQLLEDSKASENDSGHQCHDSHIYRHWAPVSKLKYRHSIQADQPLVVNAGGPFSVCIEVSD